MQEEWCITAKFGVADNANTGFLPCRKENATDDQLFLLDGDGKIHSKVDPTQCLVVDQGTEVRGGDRIRFLSCDAQVLYNTFEHNRTTDMIRVAQDTTFCLKQTGNGPDTTDTIRAEECDKNNLSFIYDYVDFECSTNLKDVECCIDSDCVGGNGSCVANYTCEARRRLRKRDPWKVL